MVIPLVVVKSIILLRPIKNENNYENFLITGSKNYL